MAGQTNAIASRYEPAQHPRPHVRIWIILQFGESRSGTRFQLCEERHTDAAQKTRQAFRAWRLAAVVLMLVNEIAAQLLKVFVA